MTDARRDYFTGLSDSQARKVRTDARAGIRHAWPHRHGLRARMVIGANVATLRDLRAVRGL